MPETCTATRHHLLRLLAVCATVAALGATPRAQAALAVGAPAPLFTTRAALAGDVREFDLAAALKQGPVVLYFYPKAFTSGCTVEAHLFAEATPTFAEMGATVIGISHDDLDTLKKFSVEACRNKFSVGADAQGKVMRQYDAAMGGRTMANRISYAISPAGQVLAVHESPAPEGHVDAMLKAVRQWHDSRAPAARP